jgi:hypothetical protein
VPDEIVRCTVDKCFSTAYLADVAEVQRVVKPWGFSLRAARGDNDVIDALVLFEGVLEKVQDGLVVGHVCPLEDRTRRLGRESGVGVNRPLLNALPCDLLSASAINVTNGNVSAVLAADFNEASSNAVGTT